MAGKGKPRVGLIVSALSGVGGIFGAAERHARLMSRDLEIVTIALEMSEREVEWSGRVERLQTEAGTAYRVRAADLRVDNMIKPELGDAFMNYDLRQRSYVDHVIKIAKEERLQALHVFGAFEARPLIGAYAALRCSVPLIISFRGADLEIRIFGRQLAGLLTALGSASLCVVNSHSNRELLEGLLRPACPVRVAHNHVDPADFDDEPVPPPASMGPLIGSLGEFRRVMGLDSLLFAFDELAERRPATLLLVGPIRRLELGYYSALQEALRHTERIVRTGPVPHRKVLSYLAACQVTAFPSISDGCPNKVLEAMLAGRPIVAGATGGIHDLIRDGREGLLVDPRDVHGLVRALESLLDDPALASRLGQAARRRARKEFSPERARRAWREAYGVVLEC